MPIRGKLHRFTDTNISNSPTDTGVYALYERGKLICIGKGDGKDGIRVRMQSHKRGDEGRCTQRATSYRRERSSNPSVREVYLLEEYLAKHGALPRCNDRIG